jgi:hypothetical protein
MLTARQLRLHLLGEDVSLENTVQLPFFRFNALKPAKRTQRGLLRPVRRRIRLLELCGKQLSLVANEIAFGEA